MTHETALVHRLQQRDASALADVFESHSDKIYRLAVGLLHDEQAADCVVQDTFVALMEGIDRFEGRATLGTWLYRVAYNHCLGRIRKERPQVDWDLLDEQALPMPEKLIDWRTLPENALHQAEVGEQVTAAVQKLSPPLRAVFILRETEDLSLDDIAAALEIPVGTVKVRLHRARLALRESLAAYFEETR